MGIQRVAIVTIKLWNIEEARRFIAHNSSFDVLMITDRKRLRYEKIKRFNPRYIFVPHWSWIIPKDIYDNFETIIFHMTDLPFGRGGSPLQNLLCRGIYQTKISALRATANMDAGPIYLKKALDLIGSAEDIYRRAAKIIFRKMIPCIVNKKLTPVAQKGKVVTFARRTPQQGNIAHLSTLRQVFDYIRMLDAEGYPASFIRTPYLKIEFSQARLKKKYVIATAKIGVIHEK